MSETKSILIYPIGKDEDSNISHKNAARRVNLKRYNGRIVRTKDIILTKNYID